MLSEQKISVAVDLTTTDESVLRYTQMLASKLNIKKIKLIHVIPSILSSGNADWEVHEILGVGFNLREKIKDKLLTTTNFIFQNGVTTDIEIGEGNPYKELLDRANDLDTDLVVVGRKKKSEGSGITAQRIARNFSKNVLFVPPTAALDINKITVPIDFSDNSARALKMAIEIAGNMKNCSVRCIHVVNAAPENYYLDLKTRNQIDSQLRLNAKNAWDIFLKKNEWKKDFVPIDYVQNYKVSIGNLLDDYFKNNGSDLIIMGAKGHTPFENFLYGSVTESLVDVCVDYPILIVR